MSDAIKKAIGWAVLALLFIGLIVWVAIMLTTPEDKPVDPKPEPKPCVCPKPDVPKTLPETGVRG